MNGSIFDKVGKKMPYEVPESYFADRAEKLSAIADRKKGTRPLMVAAAVAGVLLLSAGAWHFLHSDAQQDHLAKACKNDCMTNLYYADSDMTEEELLDLAECDVFLEYVE